LIQQESRDLRTNDLHGADHSKHRLYHDKL
jgi:hypothetical protein